MTNYRLTPDAQSDLVEIRHYTLAQWGSEQSKKHLSELRQMMLLLSETPGIGTQHSEFGTDLLSFPHSSHVIYYQCHNKQLTVFAVLHKSMVPTAHLEGREIT